MTDDINERREVSNDHTRAGGEVGQRDSGVKMGRFFWRGDEEGILLYSCGVGE